MSTRVFRRQLLLSSALVASALTGYGRRAYGQQVCTLQSGTTYRCAGPSVDMQNLAGINNATVTTGADFEVNAATGFVHAVQITGDGAISYTDTDASPLTGTAAALFLTSYGDDGATQGSVAVNTNGVLTGGDTGIRAANYGAGAVNVTANGNVTGTLSVGINAFNSAVGTFLGVTTGAGTTISGGVFGILVYNGGSGALEVKANGNVYGTGVGSTGIRADNTATGGSLTVTTAFGTTVKGSIGIQATSGGTGELTITADSAVIGTTAAGISAQSLFGGVTVKTSGIVSGREGIEVFNSGFGGADITANGDVTGHSTLGAFGINGLTSAAGTFLKITTGAGTTVSGNFSAINAFNYGSGNLEILTNGAVIANGTGISANNKGSAELDITANGTVTGTNYFGVYGYNSAAGTFLKVTTGASSLVTGHYSGINARNLGSGALDITANGEVNGGDIGIRASNSGSGLKVTTGAGSKILGGGAAGIHAVNTKGDMQIDVNGDVNNDPAAGLYGIFAQNNATAAAATITTGAGTTVKGTDTGIQARNFGSGDLKIMALGDVTGTSDNGIFAVNYQAALSVTTGAGTITGGDTGIYARNYGIGKLDVTANGDVTASAIGSKGIDARNYGSDLTVTTGANSNITGSTFGIYALNDGNGVLKITANGDVANTAGKGHGISARNYGTDLILTTGVGYSVSGGYSGIRAMQAGTGSFEITVNGDVTGRGDDAIFAASSGSPISIFIGADSTVTSTGLSFGDFAIETYGAASSITVAGTLIGSPNGGAIAFDQCNCVEGRLELHPTASITGDVLAGPGGMDKLVLGGTGSQSFNVGLISTQYQNFELFEKEDASHWTLTGVNGDTGAWAVNGGLLSVNATMADWAFTVNAGTLGGTGTIGNLVVANGGTVAPGNSIDTLHVTDVTFNAGSVYEVEIDDAGNEDLIDASGMGTINGGLVNVLAQPGAYVAGMQYTIITTNPGGSPLSGPGFADAQDNLAFLDAVVTYDAFNVYLNLVANATVFTDIAQTPNQKAVAGALSTLPGSDPLVQALLGQTTAGALQAFDALSGEIHASVGGMLIDESHFLRDSIFARLLQAFYGGGGTANVAALGANGPAIAALGGAPMMGLGMGNGGKAAPAPSSTGLAFWTQGFGSWGDFKSDGNAASADRTLGGFISGVDAGLGGGWRAGFAGGYTQTNASVDARASSADIESYHLAAYAGGDLGPLALRSGAAWTWHDIETQRAIVFPGFFQRSEASYDGDTGQVFGELAMPLGAGSTAVEAFGRLAYVHVSTGGFTESGGIAALSAGENTDNMTYSMLGARAATVMFIDGLHVTPHASVAWQHAFNDVTTDMALAFAGSGASFVIAGVPIARDSAFIEAGLDFKIAPDATLGVSYNGQLASDAQDHGISGRLDWRF